MHGTQGTALDDRPIARRQLGVLGLILLVLIVDGVDIQLLALVAPVIIEEWGTDRTAFGPALSAALIGLALGASIGGWLGDRFGRKAVLVGSTVFFGLTTIAASQADGIASLALLRFLSGLGFGAVAPNGAALATEWLPLRIRARVIGLFSVVIPLGGIISASAVLFLLEHYGWRGCFIACGLVTLVLAGMLAAFLPESPTYLRERGQPEQADRLLRRIAPGATIPFAERGEVSSALTRANLRVNLGSWLAYFSLQFIAYAILAWAPVVLTMIGWPLARAISATVAFNTCAIGAGILTGFLIERFGFRAVILAGCAGTLASIGLLAASRTELPVLVAAGGIGAFSGIGIAAIYTMLAFVYPVSCRASGIGLGLMMGRSGGIAVTLAGGFLLAVDGTNPLPFYASLGVAVLAAVAGILILGRRFPAIRPAES